MPTEQACLNETAYATRKQVQVKPDERRNCEVFCAGRYIIHEINVHRNSKQWWHIDAPLAVDVRMCACVCAGAIACGVHEWRDQ